MKRFELIIIGGGAGAFAAAIRANELKRKTAFINAGLPLGGTCVNVGCVPSKTLLYAGEILHLIKHNPLPGIELKVKKFNFQKIIQSELSLVEKMRREKYEKVLKSLKHVTLIKGRATFTGENEIEVNGKKISAEKFIIATGSTATVPPIENIKKVGFITHIEALKLKKQPKELVIVGAGPVGIEFAQMYSRFGTKVTVLYRGQNILKNFEKAFTDQLFKILTLEGITIKTNTEVKSAKIKNGKKVLTYYVKGKQGEISADEILLATGKTPNTSGLGLDIAKVKTTNGKAIKVNQFFKTTNKNIFAVGDVIDLPLRLETTAGREGTFASDNALSGTKKTIDYNTVPHTVFTDPQLSMVGLTEERQMEAMNICSCRTIPFTIIPKAAIMSRTEGMIKMGIHPKTKQIFGVHILSPNSSELIAEAGILIKNKNTIEDVENTFPVFPTLSEAVRLVALSFTKDVTKLSCCT